MDALFFVVQEVTEADVVSVQSLLSQLGYPHDTEDVQDRIRLYRKTSIKDSFFKAGGVVAQAKGKVIGLLAWSQQELFVENKVRFHVEALVIDKQWQGKGVGRALLAYVERLEPDRDRIIDLTSRAYRAATGAHAFYRHLGYDNTGASEKVYLRKDIRAEKPDVDR